MLYGLVANGEAGVLRALQIIHRELDLTMASCGCTDIAQFGRRMVRLTKRSGSFLIERTRCFCGIDHGLMLSLA